MTQTQSVHEHLTAVRDELKAAAQKEDTVVRERINVALQHAQTAKAALSTQAASANVDAKRRANDATKHLDELTKTGKQALQERGAELQSKLQTMIAHAKEAVDSSK